MTKDWFQCSKKYNASIIQKIWNHHDDISPDTAVFILSVFYQTIQRHDITLNEDHKDFINWFFARYKCHESEKLCEFIDATDDEFDQVLGPSLATVSFNTF